MFRLFPASLTRLLYSDIRIEDRVHCTKLRKVGGSVMLVVPPPILDALELQVGACVGIGIEAGRRVVTPNMRVSFTLDDLLAQCDKTGPAEDGDRVWIQGAAIGSELL